MPDITHVYRTLYSKMVYSIYPKSYLTVVLFMATLLLASCSTPLPTVPSFDTDGQHHPGKIIWHDLVTPDIKQARSFYSKLFGWTFKDVTDGYTLIYHNGQNIGGMAKHERSGNSAYWIPLMSVDMKYAILPVGYADGYDFLLSNKGKVLIKAFELPGRGRIAVVHDPLGAIFALAQTSAGDPAVSKAGTNEWLWHEIWTDDFTASEKFYSGLIGYQTGEDTSGEQVYHYLKYKDVPRAGLVKKQNSEIANTWVAYIRVDDVAATAAQVEASGGKILMSPRPDIRNSSVAIITDPSGAGLVIQEWNK